ncbi:hypothetical protein PsorP6_011232 [Peronosclerospora sorghi]|uniref:Uncharacterized protein n=1 Tax=Peronosclerospora sorghi TaxID=230839 RepID=A0ACC0VYQ7_9STRA|nr:hypothetical protein PsorP6_011232 [Peronosclerospora sorghi]
MRILLLVKMVRDVISRLRAGALRVAPVLDPSKSALPAHSTSGSSSRSLSLSWPRLLLFCIVLYVCALVAYLVNTSPSTPFPKLHEVSSKAVTIAQAEEHARSVKMLPQGQKHDRGLRCIGWRATDNCSPYGPRLPKLDKPCHMLVKHEQSGYCEVEDIITKERFRVMKRYCRSLRPDSQFRCEEAQDFVNFPIQANKSFADFSFRGLENYLRRCAMEAAQIIHAEPHVRF